MKRQIKYILNRFGYDIMKIPRTSSIYNYECHSDHETYDMLFSHKREIDTYQYADQHSTRVASFKDKIGNGTYMIIDHSCAICNSNDYTLVAKSIEGFAWGICKQCGLLQLHNRLRDCDINVFYESGEYQAVCMGNINDEKHFSLEYQIMSLYFINTFRLLGLRPSETSVIEIGCGSGGILLALKEWGAKSVRGYDIDRHRVSYGKTHIAEIEVADALSLNPDIFSSKNFNVVLLSNVLEHLVDPKEFLVRLSSQIESPNVRIFVDVPNLEYCYSYSQASFLKFLHIGHLWYFNSISIERLLNEFGLAVDYILPRGAAFTVICSKRPGSIVNSNNGYWNSISSINYANYLNDPNNIGVAARRRMESL